MQTSPFGFLWDGADTDPKYLASLERMRFVYRLGELMESYGLNNKQIADRIGVSAPYVSTFLRGEGNFTLETMIKFALAFDHQIRIDIEPTESEWPRFVAEKLTQEEPEVKLPCRLRVVQSEENGANEAVTVKGAA